MNLSNNEKVDILIKGLLALLVVVVLAMVMRFWVTPYVLKIDRNFSYSADILSLDNFFDEENNVFGGETLSVTTYGYDVANVSNEGIILSNFFDVRTVSGENIFAVERKYGIDPIRWEHNAKLGDKERNGYLFGPRNLSKNKVFKYWHINYDKELNLLFESEEIINGLNTYRYSASFGVDQTINLTHLRGVPEERGVNLDVSLRVWIEPVSGWLVKYQDEAIAYYYDIETGKRLNPWNKFSNTYRRFSVEEQVNKARFLRNSILTFNVVTPFLVFIMLLAVLFWRFRRNVSIGVLVLGVLALLGYSYFALFQTANNSDPIRIGISRWVPLGNTAYDDNIMGFKDALELAGYKKGRDVVYIEETSEADVDKQKVIIQSFLEQDVDLIYSLTTPGTLITKELVPNRPIVFSIVTYPLESGLIKGLKQSGNNLVGTRNWVPVKEQLDNFRRIVPTVNKLGFIHRTGEANSLVQFNEMKKELDKLGIGIVSINGLNFTELKTAIENISSDVDSVYSACDTLVQGEAEEFIISYATANRIPSFSCNISGPLKGNLIGTVASFYDIGKLAGEKAVLIFDGATPSSLTTDTAARSFVYINQNTASQLNIVIPQELRLQATKIIKN